MAHAPPWLRRGEQKVHAKQVIWIAPAPSPASLHQPLVPDKFQDAGEDDDANEHGGAVDAPEASRRLRDAGRDDHILTEYRCTRMGQR